MGTADDDRDLYRGFWCGIRYGGGFLLPAPPTAGDFGDRLTLAQEYRDILATDGIIQGADRPSRGRPAVDAARTQLRGDR